MNAFSDHIRSRTPRRLLPAALTLACAALAAPPAQASLLSGEALDTMANVVAWLAIIVVPVVLLTVFWLVHILPEKIAEKRRHPQLAAIKTLCLLSLFFGGLLWPLAWLWAYTKPVLHKMAYGTDVDDHDSGSALTPFHDASKASGPVTPEPSTAETSAAADRNELQLEVDTLQKRIRELEMALAMSGGRRGAPADRED